MGEFVSTRTAPSSAADDPGVVDAPGVADRSREVGAPTVHLRSRLALGLAVAGVVVVNALNAAVLVSWRYDLGFVPELSGWLLMARENNPTTWLSSALFVVAAGLALLLAGLASGSHDSAERRGWWMVAGGLAFLSLDETASIHERIGPPIVEGSGALENAWWVVFVPVAIVAVVLLRRFWSSVERPLRLGLLAAGAIYVAGAAFVESLAKWWEERQGEQDLPYYAISTVEENLELLGVLVLCVVLVRAWRRAGGRLDLTLG